MGGNYEFQFIKNEVIMVHSSPFPLSFLYKKKNHYKKIFFWSSFPPSIFPIPLSLILMAELLYQNYRKFGSFQTEQWVIF